MCIRCMSHTLRGVKLINVTISKSGFICEGHANHAEYGKDIVCSAVSALTQATLLGLNRYGAEMDVTRGEGFIKVGVFKPTPPSITILTTMYLGMKKIARDYKECVTVKGRM